eukprot:jgi/Bigna1/140038/aug1.53_g14746
MVKKAGGKKNQESVQVCVRLRPLNSKEKSKKCKQVLFVNSDRGEVAVKHSQDSEDYDEMKRYTYDFAFPPTVTQEEVGPLDSQRIDVDSVTSNDTAFETMLPLPPCQVFDLTARPIVESVMEGYNGAYQATRAKKKKMKKRDWPFFRLPLTPILSICACNDVEDTLLSF